MVGQDLTTTAALRRRGSRSGRGMSMDRPDLLVELTYFWGIAGTLQAVAFPDLSSTFPHLVWFQYTAGHLGIVFAALFLVVGMGLKPRKGPPSGSLR